EKLPGKALAGVEIAVRPLASEHELEPDPANHEMACRLEIECGIGKARLGIVHRNQKSCNIAKPGEMIVDNLAELGQVASGLSGARAARSDLGAEQVESSPLGHRDFPAKQVARLDAMCSLVDRIEAVIAVELLDI